MPYHHRAYTHFQLIAYHILTLDVVGPGAECPAVARLPVPALQNADSRIRLKRLAAVVDMAQQRVAADDNAQTLKVFMVPEFYFRPNTGPYNSYNQSTALNLLDALLKLFAHDDFRDWLIVPGTIFWNQLGSDGAEVFFNTAPLIKGGPDGPREYMHKREMANIDGAPVLRMADHDPALRPLLTSWNELSHAAASFDFRRFGLEVCLDHADQPSLRRLRALYQHTLETGRRRRMLLDLHLLVACGMPANPETVTAAAGKHFLRVDGHPDFFGSEMWLILRQPYGTASVDYSLVPADPGAPRLATKTWTARINAAPMLLDPMPPEEMLCRQSLNCYHRQPL